MNYDGTKVQMNLALEEIDLLQLALHSAMCGFRADLTRYSREAAAAIERGETPDEGLAVLVQAAQDALERIERLDVRFRAVRRT